MEHPQEIKLSFVVPIYNVKPYIKKCVESLLHQDYDNYEIILVDDGSTDQSGLIADQLACDVRCNADAMENGMCGPEIHVIHQENRGLSGARNTGIAVAKGEYICFVDSDDYWEENVLGGLMTQVERDNLDVLRFNYRNVDEQGKLCPFVSNPWGEVVRTEDVSDGETFLNTRLGYACYAWGFILRKSLLTPALSPRREEGACLISPDSSLVESRGDHSLNHTYAYRETGDGMTYGLQKEHATNMRIGSTEAENALWQMLRGKQIGYKFRRQHPIGEFIADFICLEAQLIVEADGGYHLTSEQQEEDARRTRILNERGYHIVRFTNEQILCDPDTTLSRIRAKLQERLDAKKRGEWRSSFPTGERGDDKEGKEACLFTEGILFEDTDWTPRMLVKAERVADTSTVVYNYMIRQSGITQSRSIEKLHREINDKITLIGRLNTWYAERPLDWYQGMRAALVISVLKLISTHLYAERGEILKQLKAARAFPIKAYHMRKKVVRAIRIINISPRLYVWLKHIR